jgi:type IV secretory pathway TraG/TraD family ATPase VirD4
VFVYLGGVRENDFLQHISQLIGTYDRETTSASMNKGVRSTSTSPKRENILEVAELADLPRGRAIMLSSGTRAALLRTVPWFQGPKEQVAAIQASIAAHDPASKSAAPVSLTPAAPVTTAVLDRPAAGSPAEEPPVQPSALSALLTGTENEPRTDTGR